jgi:hypothetical protein
MSVVIIGPEEQAEINRIVAEARVNFIPLEALKESALPDKSVVTLKDRKSVPMRPDNRHIMLGDTMAAFSFEQQPAGMCRHLSVSVRWKGKLPHPEAVEMIAKAFGFTEFPTGITWLEEFEPGHHAVNVVQVEGPVQ